MRFERNRLGWIGMAALALCVGAFGSSRAQAGHKGKGKGHAATVRLSRPAGKVTPSTAERITGDEKTLTTPRASKVKLGSSSLLAGSHGRHLDAAVSEGGGSRNLRPPGKTQPASSRLQRLDGKEAKLASGGVHTEPRLLGEKDDNRVERLRGWNGSQKP